MFDVGGGEFLVLLILGLLIFGPRKLPEMGRQFGGFVGQMRRAMQEFRGTLEREVALDEMKEAAKEVKEIRADARAMTRELIDGVGAPPPADPSRRLREEQRGEPAGDAVDPGVVAPVLGEATDPVESPAYGAPANENPAAAGGIAEPGTPDGPAEPAEPSDPGEPGKAAP